LSTIYQQNQETHDIQTFHPSKPERTQPMKLKMNTLLALVAFGATVACITPAQALEAEAAISANNAYVFRGATINDDINVNPSASIDIYKGLTFGTWGNFNTDTSQFDEIDYTLGYEFDLGNGFSPGITYIEYTYPGAEGDADREVLLTESTSIAGVGLDLLVGIGIDGAFEDGIYLEAKPQYSLPIASDLGLDIGVTIGAELGDNFDDNGVSHVTLDTGTSYNGFDIGLAYVIEADDDVLAVDEDFIVTVGYGF